MYCNVCGTERKVRYRPNKLQSLCEECNKGTHKKCSYSTFSKIYWKEGIDFVAESIKKEFYRDYLASQHNINQYINVTTLEVA